MKMDKKERESLKEKVEALGFKVAKVQNVISNGNKIRMDKGQGTKWSDEKRMIAILIEVDDIVSKD